MSSQKLNSTLRIICNSDSVGKKELPLQRLAPVFNVDTPDLNSYPLKLTFQVSKYVRK
jgi:hypothetical protein